MKVQVFKRGIDFKNWKSNNHSDEDIKVVYCGFLEVDNPMDEDLWEWCNWSCWSEECPKECSHLLIGVCNSDVSFCIDGEFYSHNMHKFIDFEECYSEMCKEYSKYFRAIWPHQQGFGADDDSQLQYVTPNNVANYIK